MADLMQIGNDLFDPTAFQSALRQQERRGFDHLGANIKKIRKKLRSYYQITRADAV